MFELFVEIVEIPQSHYLLSVIYFKLSIEVNKLS